MGSVYNLDPSRESANVDLLEAMRRKLAEGFGVAVVGNRVTLRWHENGEANGRLLSVHMVVVDTVTPADADELDRKQREYEAIVAKARKKYPDIDADVFHAECDEWPQ